MATWSSIPGLEAYEVSNTGRVRKAASRYELIVTRKGLVRLTVDGVQTPVEVSFLQDLARGAVLFIAPELVKLPALPPEEVFVQAAPREPVYIDLDEPDVPVTARRACNGCRKLVDLEAMTDGMCRTCSAKPSKAKKPGRRCRTCGKALTPEYWYKCSYCWGGRASSSEDCRGVEL